MRTVLVSFTCFLLAAGCEGKPEKPPHPEVKPALDPAPTKVQPELAPVQQDANFPKERWVRTTTFDGKSFFGFSYTDPSKGNSIKGVVTEGLSDEELSTKLNGPPGMTLSPIPAGHAVVPLTDAELEILKLPPEPDWLSFYKPAPGG